jgi:hypothetical protein
MLMIESWFFLNEIFVGLKFIRNHNILCLILLIRIWIVKFKLVTILSLKFWYKIKKQENLSK